VLTIGGVLLPEVAAKGRLLIDQNKAVADEQKAAHEGEETE
jgi:hypothetical protein